MEALACGHLLPYERHRPQGLGPLGGCFPPQALQADMYALSMPWGSGSPARLPGRPALPDPRRGETRELVENDAVSSLNVEIEHLATDDATSYLNADK